MVYFIVIYICVFFRHLLDQIPEGPISIVSDSYDIFNMLENIFGGELKDRIEKRQGIRLHQMMGT